MAITRVYRVLVLLLLAACLTVVPVMAGSVTSLQVKAAMLIKFTDFITWPNQAFEGSPDTFAVGVLGDREFVRLLMPLEGKLIQGRRLKIIDLDRAGEKPPALHVLYVGASGIHRWKTTIGGRYWSCLLTVSDSDLFISQGGIMQFVEKSGNRMGFAVNRSAQIKSRLKFSASLLRLAIIRELEPGEAP
ncbi:MAG: YfiR family protein [Desulfobacteraceae bacterium]|nr:YfiR family protein [Desulfobacteraceae bacterium]